MDHRMPPRRQHRQGAHQLRLGDVVTAERPFRLMLVELRGLQNDLDTRPFISRDEVASRLRRALGRFAEVTGIDA